MTILRDLAETETSMLLALGGTSNSAAPEPMLGAWDNRPTWDNAKGGSFDNKPSWDNWSKKK